MTKHQPISPAAELHANVSVPFNKARAMPKSVYTSEAFLAQEQQHIFAREWLCVGRAESLPEPSDYLTLDIAGEPVIVLLDPRVAGAMLDTRADGLPGVPRHLLHAHVGLRMLAEGHDAGNARRPRRRSSSWQHRHKKGPQPRSHLPGHSAQQERRLDAWHALKLKQAEGTCADAGWRIGIHAIHHLEKVGRG